MSVAIQGVDGNSDKSPARSTSVRPGESAALHDRELLGTLRRSKLYRKFERAFTEAIGLPLALRPIKFFGLPFHGKKNENAFCAFLADGKSSCAFCLQTQCRITGK
jgi:hypothetical protein